jgi:hypothetical protein
MRSSALRARTQQLGVGRHHNRVLPAGARSNEKRVKRLRGEYVVQEWEEDPWCVDPEDREDLVRG